MSELLLHKELSYKVQGAFFAVYKAFGNAFKETVYHNALLEEFKSADIKVESQKRIDIYYRDKKVGSRKVEYIRRVYDTARKEV